MPAIICSGVILVASGIPGNYLPEVISFRDWLGPDKFVHLVLFGAFQYFLLDGLQKSQFRDHIRSSFMLLFLTIGIVFGIITELLQRYVFTGRSANIYDAVADAIGCAMGLGIFLLILKKRTMTS
jgi:VanZ family protein